MLENALRLCGAAFGTFWTHQSRGMIPISRRTGPKLAVKVSTRNARKIMEKLGYGPETWPYSVTAALMRDVKNQAPKALCELRTTGGSTNLLLNRDRPPFDNPSLRKALALTLDRQAFIDIMTEGLGRIGGAQRRLKGCGACRPRCCERSRAMI